MKTLLLLMAVLYAHAPLSFENSVLALSGASALEELDESEMERYEHFHSHPVHINTASRSRLLSCGLLSSYQVASLMDYRLHSGAILSAEELSLVDGFNHEFCSALSPFISFDSTAPPGERQVRRISNDLTLKTSLRQDGAPYEESLPAPQLAAGFKYGLELGERLSFCWSSRTTYSQSKAVPGTMSLAYYPRSGNVKILAGDFAARFGQGLAMWSGFSMGGFSSVSSFRRSGTGLSPTGSFTPMHRGLAADWTRGGWTLSAALSLPGLRERMEGKDVAVSLLPILNIAKISRRMRVGMTFRPSCLAADFQLGLNSASVFGELAYDFAGGDGWGRHLPAAVLGGMWIPSYGNCLSIAARLYPASFDSEWSGAVRSSSKTSDEIGIAIGAKLKYLEITFDYSEHPGKQSRQLKGIVRCSPEFNLKHSKLLPSLRLSARYNTAMNCPLRLDMRTDLTTRFGRAEYSLRADLAYGQGLAGYFHSDLGWKGKLTAHLRAALFHVDNWNDRIYVYEHDAPGNFTVPAYYGRGYALSAYLGRRGRRHSLYLRTSLSSYPWTESAKVSRAEFKLQYRLQI